MRSGAVLKALAGLTGVVLLCGSALAASPAPEQKSYASPKAAADALVTAAEKFDVEALKLVLGPDGIDLVVTEDAVQDRNQAAAFAAKAREKLVVVPDPKDPKVATLSVGAEDWPVPIPVVNVGGKWKFDTAAGREEVFLRRIGQNELDAIQACRSFVKAQHEYASKKRDDARVNQYAQKIISTPGRQDGLAWRNADGSFGGPLAEGIARAVAEGYSDKREPYHGYTFKVLKGQGPSAPLGELDFVVQGAMIGGFALVASPADYEKTGVKTFIVSHDGIVYEKDLGPGTLEAFRSMERYDPDESWAPVEEP
ncbi:DUF2950 domain-containing protein [Acidobacteria bacterium ACD]|nr:MAG: DUF2950 domain-containing protein [Acidobacteriota bacterium]MCE7957001.1 DUF2950 domain-containing protein [Acidobacteria bacterium ACB2]MDL1948529.1 DUF2950 domain-containing protein [Acidobacteria bacterium ACD]